MADAERDRSSILVVDDTPAHLEMLAEMLQGRGYEVRRTTSARLALAAARADVPDLVLADIGMPEMDGFELCRAFKANPRLAEVPVIFLSASSEVDDKVNALRVGGVDYVTKPFQEEEVVARVATHLELCRQRRELAAKNAALIEADQLKNRFLGMAAHDLRSPLAAVRGYLGLLASGHLGALLDAQKEILERVDAACGRMVELIEELLDINAIEAGRLELDIRELPLQELLASARDSAAMLAKPKSIRVVLEPVPALPGLQGDRARIEQVLDNLLSNAIKFSPPCTTVTLSARRLEREAVVSVTDEGPGIPLEEQAGVFKDFGRTSVRPTGGERSIGLGLAISRRLIEAHGGRLGLRSAVGVGSTFSFELPLDRRARAPVGGPGESAPRS